MSDEHFLPRRTDLLGETTKCRMQSQDRHPVFLFLSESPRKEERRPRKRQFDFSSTLNHQLSTFYGGIAQLVERQLCKLEVRGSNPLASKISHSEIQMTFEGMRTCSTGGARSAGLKAKLTGWSQRGALDNPLASKAFKAWRQYSTRREDYRITSGSVIPLPPKHLMI